MELQTALLSRRSGRKYNGNAIPEEALKKILTAGLLAPSGRNLKPVSFVVVQGADELAALSKVKNFGASMLKSANAAIVVLGRGSDTWIEDGAIAMTQMMLTATELGVANCWVQCRCRVDTNGQPAPDAVRKLLDIPEDYSVLSILSLGMSDELLPAHTESEADWSKVHYQTF